MDSLIENRSKGLNASHTEFGTMMFFYTYTLQPDRKSQCGWRKSFFKLVINICENINFSGLLAGQRGILLLFCKVRRHVGFI